MADSEVRQKFEARVLETVKYSKREDFVIGEYGYDNPNLQEWFQWFAAGMRAGEIARWIPVEEKLPPRHQDVLCYNRDGEIFQGRICAGMHKPFFTYPRGFGDPSNTAPDWINVTHWQPLPAAPEEKKP